MDKAKVLAFSGTLRNSLLEETKKRAAHFGIFPGETLEVEREFEDSVIIGGKIFSVKIKKQREVLVREIRQKGYMQVIEEITYIWFNRFVAIRFMEANGYMPVRVFSSKDEGRNEPEILTKALNLKFLHLDRDYVLDLKSEGEDEELYRYLIMRLCNYLHITMPFMFENIEDYSELLFPERLLHTDSLLGCLNDIISEDDWREAEIIGWIYQDYIADKKDELMKAKKAYAPNQIPAVTQLFTPKWIVQYLVENSLGRLWMLNRPDSGLCEEMEYYIIPEEKEKDFLRIFSPEEIKVCDPACGSGHMLVYAFDLLCSIYEEEGYSESEIPEIILKNNLYGIEIDGRAGSLAAFALVMKARKRNKKFFDSPVQPNICVLENIEFDDEELKDYMASVGNNLFSTGLKETLLQFKETDNFGSLIRPAATGTDPSETLRMLKEKNLSSSLTLFATHKKVKRALEQADYLSRKYHVVVANPPYMGNKGMNSDLKKFAKDNYPESKSDLFAMFIERNLDLSVKKGLIAMITMQSWMFLSSYEKLRDRILDNETILTMAHLGPRAFDSIGGEVVSTTAFVIENNHKPDYKGAYIRLVDGRNEDEKKRSLREAVVQSGKII
ncbi:BREX-1 system adenine-specific DNA-methyltransferase PglX [Methanoplanus limicola]|uniref:site-specific DNA-methyltransferase (adenine-specific) n=1 Tax=Methanoplanus limicola DSM 2279 TaxID=937775 RepID=H1Z3P6_9EURY|nr:BREX-1 system adenine-specific DNA-methyltransferase PglX [Methanoplanus limicola]EHQ35645.1 type IIS restriction enzyme [Methanoplanus limicola DSM 2279]